MGVVEGRQIQSSGKVIGSSPYFVYGSPLDAALRDGYPETRIISAFRAPSYLSQNTPRMTEYPKMFYEFPTAQQGIGRQSYPVSAIPVSQRLVEHEVETGESRGPITRGVVTYNPEKMVKTAGLEPWYPGMLIQTGIYWVAAIVIIGISAWAIVSMYQAHTAAKSGTRFVVEEEEI